MLLHVCRAESEGPGQIILEKFFPASLSLPITIRYCGFSRGDEQGKVKMWGDANKGTVPERVQSWLCRIGKQSRTNLITSGASPQGLASESVLFPYKIKKR